MSKKLSVDFNPLLKKVQTDISFLCYLGLHQYAKENQLIGRSRPMITSDLDFTKQKRLNFRLLVACLQQIIGTKTMNHEGRIEQVNYVNVGEYSMMRLYGLFDRKMFAVYTEKDKCYTGYWPQQIDNRDMDLLRSPNPLKAFEGDLGHNTRAMMEVGGHIFSEKLRTAIRLIPRDLDDFVPHQQRDPKNRMNVKNIAVQLRLVETKHFRTLRQPGTPAIHDRSRTHPGLFNVPTHIEQLLHFRHVIWPWIQSLQTQEARDAFTYVAQNFPSVHAVQMKMRSIRESAQERQRIMQAQQERARQMEEDRQQLRERLLAIYGNRPETPEETAEQITIGNIENADVVQEGGEVTPHNNIEIEFVVEDHDGPQIEHVRGTHGMENEEPGAAFEREIMRRRNFADPQEIIPLPDLHHGTVIHENIGERVRRALGIAITREDEDDDEEIPF